MKKNLINERKKNFGVVRKKKEKSTSIKQEKRRRKKEELEVVENKLHL